MTSVVPRLPQPRLVVRQQQVHTTSLAVAEFFGKNHFHVMRDIATLIGDCQASIGESNSGLADAMLRQFSHSNFEATSYTDEQGKSRPMYLLTKDGFVLLAIGFTGKAALQWKIRYIEAFNRMALTLAGGLGVCTESVPARNTFCTCNSDVITPAHGVADLLSVCGGVRVPAQVLEVLLRHGAHQTPVYLSYREILRATGSQVSVSGVRRTLKTLARFSYVEQVPAGTGGIRVLAALFARLSLSPPFPALAVATGLRQ